MTYEATCAICSDTGWVCENHPDRVWYGLMKDGHPRCCDVSAGMPCDNCNPCDEHNPPKKTGMASVYYNRNGVNH